jgi:hypothetical protein
LGVRLGLALGEGSSLELAGAGCFVELPAEGFVLSLQVVDPSRKGLAVVTPNRFHTRIVCRSGTCNRTASISEMVYFDLGALIKNVATKLTHSTLSAKHLYASPTRLEG